MSVQYEEAVKCTQHNDASFSQIAQNPFQAFCKNDKMGNAISSVKDAKCASTRQIISGVGNDHNGMHTNELACFIAILTKSFEKRLISSTASIGN